MARALEVIAVLLMVAGCQMHARPASVAPGIALVPDDQGLLVLPQNMRIDFGRSPKGVVPVLDRELGAHKAHPLSGCPATVVAQHQWADLVLVFTAERFVGWRQGAQSQGMICAL